MIAIPNTEMPKSCYNHCFEDFIANKEIGCPLNDYIESHQYKNKTHPDCPLIGIDKETEHHILNLWEYAKDMGVNMEQARKDLTVVDLVRCGECKWSYKDERDGLMWCKVHMSHYRVNADHFCAYGDKENR